MSLSTKMSPSSSRPTPPFDQRPTLGDLPINTRTLPLPLLRTVDADASVDHSSTNMGSNQLFGLPKEPAASRRVVDPDVTV